MEKANVKIMEVEVRYYKNSYYCLHMYNADSDWSIKIEITKEEAKNIEKIYNLKIHKHV